MVEASEETITRSVGRLLERHGWTILGLHFPGTQGGFRLSGAGLRGKGDVIPDIVAVRANVIVFAETKPQFSPADLKKVLRVRSDHAMMQQLRGLTHPPGGVPRGGLCFAGPRPDHLPDDLLVFHYASPEHIDCPVWVLNHYNAKEDDPDA